MLLWKKQLLLWAWLSIFFPFNQLVPAVVVSASSVVVVEVLFLTLQDIQLPWLVSRSESAALSALKSCHLQGCLCLHFLVRCELYLE
jgi:hypothetical protein